MKGFLDFIREQGVVGLAVGFILGGAVSKLVTGLITNIINPLLGLALGRAKGLTSFALSIGDTKLEVGEFLSVLIDFIVIALVVYFGVKKLGLDKMDKPKEKK